MIFKDSVELLELKETSLFPKTYEWIKISKLWCESEVLLSNRVVISTLGIKTKCVKFVMYKKNIRFTQALRWKNSFCYIIDIIETELFSEVTAAIVETSVCKITTESTTYNALKNPVKVSVLSFVFPAIRTEKLYEVNSDKIKLETERNEILVVPKNITLNVGDLLEINSTKYEVANCHELEMYRNNYEVRQRRDV